MRGTVPVGVPGVVALAVLSQSVLWDTYSGGVRAFPREVLTGSKWNDRTGDLHLFDLRICIGKLPVNYVMVGLSYEKCKEML